MSQGYDITINGVTHTLTQWCKIYNMKTNTVCSRVQTGMTYEEALTKPLQFGGHTRAFPKKSGVKPVHTDYGYKAKRSAKCKKCYYAERAGSQWVCMYIVIHPDHHRRPCPAGNECTVFMPKNRRLTDAQREFFKSYIYGGSHV